MKIGKISINAERMAAKGKGKFGEWAKKSPVTAAIMKTRTNEQKQAWVDNAWDAIQAEVKKVSTKTASKEGK